MCKLDPYKDGRFVADIKLRHIDNIAEQAKEAKNIRRIMLFGSALEERCSERSDIDIAVFGTKAKGSYQMCRKASAFRHGDIRHTLFPRHLTGQVLAIDSKM